MGDDWKRAWTALGDAGLIRDRYQPTAVMGRGGQGEVLQALDTQHGRPVALKIRPVPDADARDAILAEARILLSLGAHPNLPLVREDFFWRDRYVLVMDWVQGTDLGRLLVETGDPGLHVSERDRLARPGRRRPRTTSTPKAWSTAT